MGSDVGAERRPPAPLEVGRREGRSPHARRSRTASSFASPAAKDRAATIFDSDPWRKLGANRDNRVFVVNNEIWQTGEGVVAARGVIDDLRFVNAPIN